MIRSELWRPPVLALTVSRPVVRPERPPPVLSAFLGHLHGHPRRHREALHRAFAAALLGDPVERRLGILDLALGIDLVRGVERLLDHLAPDADQRAKQGEIVNLLGEIARADDRRAAAGQLGEIGGPAHLLHLLVGLEQGPQRHRAGDHVLVEQAQDLLVDPPVQRLEEMLGPELELDILGEPVVDHQRAEQARPRPRHSGAATGCRRSAIRSGSTAGPYANLWTHPPPGSSQQPCGTGVDKRCRAS